MAIDFPTSKYTVADGVSQNSWPGSPSSGDTATANSYTYTYNGTLWVMNSGSTKSFTGGATYTWDGEKWDASNIPDNSNVVQSPSGGWANGELLQYNGTSWDSVDLIIDEDDMSSDSDTKIPTQQSVKKYVDDQVADVIDSAPATLDTLNELAAALNDDANFATTVTNNIATKLSLAGGTMTGNIVMSGTETVDGRDLSVDGAKLDLIEAGATADQTAAEIKTSYESNADTNAFTDAEQTKLAGIAAGAEVNVQSDWNASSGDSQILNKPTIPSATSDLTNDSGFITADATKLPLAGGTMSGDIAMGSNKITGLGTPTASTDASTKGYVDTQISASGGGTVTSVSGTAPISVTNGTTTPAITISAATTSAAGTMSSSDKSKLDGIEAGATADQTAAEIKSAYESNSDTNAFTDAEQTKLAGIETGATADQTAAEIKTAYESNANTNEFSDAEQTKLAGIATNANNYSHPNHTGEVTSTGDGATVIADNVVDEANLKVSNTPNNGYVLTARSGNTGGMTWEEISAAGATGGGSDTIFWENGTTVTSNYTVGTTYGDTNNCNAMSAGPITINSGVTVTVNSGSRWIIV